MPRWRNTLTRKRPHARDAVGEVGLAVAGELVGPVLGQDGEGQPLGVGRAEDVERRLGQVAVDPDVRRRLPP